MSEVLLDQADIVAFAGEMVAYGMTEHVRVVRKGGVLQPTLGTADEPGAV